ncbi:MAG: hypothetical protein K2G01_02005, partial [Paramuribaculum sp.]|nr:hypothetical protein [Paramuribaculum sp.]
FQGLCIRVLSGKPLLEKTALSPLNTAISLKGMRMVLESQQAKKSIVKNLGIKISDYKAL